MITGIYIIKNILNNKIYVGSTIDIKKRWRDHKWHLKENKHHNSHLQASYNKYGFNVNDPQHIYLGQKCKKHVKELSSKRMLDDKNPMYGKFGKEHPKYGISLSKEKRNIISNKMKLKKGCEANASKLNENIVLYIRNKYVNENFTQTKLSKLFNVTQATISDIINRKTWSHI